MELISERPSSLTALNENFLRSPREDVFFLFVEKVGCTTLKALLIKRLLGDVSRIDAGYFAKGWTSTNLTHFLSWSLRVDGRTALATPDAKVITFCRNPYDRFVSAYYDKIIAPKSSEEEYFLHIRRDILIQKAKRTVGAPISWNVDGGTSLKGFAEYVYFCGPEERDRHWAAQHLINLADLMEPDVFIRLEQFDEQLSQVWSRFFGEELTMEELRPRNLASRPGNALTSDVAEVVYTIYKRDFEIFGYDPESWRLF